MGFTLQPIQLAGCDTIQGSGVRWEWLGYYLKVSLMGTGLLGTCLVFSSHLHVLRFELFLSLCQLFLLLCKSEHCLLHETCWSACTIWTLVTCFFNLHWQIVWYMSSSLQSWSVGADSRLGVSGRWLCHYHSAHWQVHFWSIYQSCGSGTPLLASCRFNAFICICRWLCWETLPTRIAN